MAPGLIEVAVRYQLVLGCIVGQNTHPLVASLCGWGFPMTWWLSSKGSLETERERERQNIAFYDLTLEVM